MAGKALSLALGPPPEGSIDPGVACLPWLGGSIVLAVQVSKSPADSQARRASAWLRPPALVKVVWEW